MNVETAVEDVTVTTEMPDSAIRAPLSLQDFPEFLPSQENFNSLDMVEKKKDWKAMEHREESRSNKRDNLVSQLAP